MSLVSLQVAVNGTPSCCHPLAPPSPSHMPHCCVCNMLESADLNEDFGVALHPMRFHYPKNTRLADEQQALLSLCL